MHSAAIVKKEVSFCIFILSWIQSYIDTKPEEFLEPILAYTHFVAKNKDGPWSMGFT